MQKLKGVIKKLSAISVGVAMLGASLTGAMAADLKDYPAPFVNVAGKKFDYLLVLGSGATGEGAAKDTSGALDIASGLSSVPVASSGTAGSTVTVVGGQSEDVPLTANLAASNQFDSVLTDDDIESLIDGEVTFQSTSYDVSEELLLNLNKNTSIQTSLSSSDDDYTSDVRMEVEKNALVYLHRFDESIQVNKTTNADPLEIKFLGKTLKITSVDSATKITASVGTEYVLSSGEVVEVDGKTITLSKVGSGGDVAVEVDGVSKILSDGQTATVNGIEIKNSDQFYDSNNQASSSANLIIGTDAVDTVQDGGKYFGGDDTCSNDDPKDPDCWKWVVKNMNNIGTTTYTSTAANGISWGTAATAGPVLALQNDFALNDYKDNPPKAGECIAFPNDYLSICFDSLTTNDEEDLKITLQVDSGFDSEASEAGVTIASGSKALLISSNVDDTLAIDVDAAGFGPNGTLSSDIKTDKIWLNPHNDTTMGIYYENTNGVTVLAGRTGESNRSNFAYIDNSKVRGTTGTAIVFNLTTEGIVNATGSSLYLSLEPADTDLTPAASDTIITRWNVTNGHIVNSLGHSISSEESTELQWETTGIGTKDEDHRSRFGIIIKNPKSKGSGDKVDLEVPTDYMQANVVIKGTSATVTGGTAGSSVVMAAVDKAPSPVVDTEVTSKTGDNLILVGGPAVNKLSAEFLGLTYPAYGAASGINSGEAIISLKDNGEKVAMIVAGYESADTIRASRVLRDYAANKANLKGAEVTVKGTTSNPSVVASTSA